MAVSSEVEPCPSRARTGLRYVGLVAAIGIVMLLGILRSSGTSASDPIVYNNMGGPPSASGVSIVSFSTNLAKPFTAQLSGDVTAASFWISCTNFVCGGSGTFEIRNDQGGLPGTDVLASATFIASSPSLGSNPTCIGLGVGASLTQGTKYWAVMHRDSGTLNWHFMNDDPEVGLESADGANWTPLPANLQKELSLRLEAGECGGEALYNPASGVPIADMFAQPGNTAFNTITIENVGNSGLTAINATFGGDDPGVFQLRDSQPHPILGGPLAFPRDITASVTMIGYVQCTPPIDGVFTADLTINSDDGSSATWPLQCVADSTPPTLQFNHVPDGANGWFVTVPAPIPITGLDDISSVKLLECVQTPLVFGFPTLYQAFASSATFNIGGEGEVALDCSATDLANNVGMDSIVLRVDSRPPQISPSLSPPATAAGWHNADVSVTFACNDDLPGSGIANDTVGGGGVYTDETTGTLVESTGSCSDVAGHSAATASLTIKIDKTPPVITPIVTPAPDANGINNSAVGVVFVCSDPSPGSGVGLDTLDGGGHFADSTPGTLLTSTGMCEDLAGNQAAPASVLIKIALDDYGDAPDPGYTTLLANDGARHLIDGTTYLGLGVDAETDGQQSPAATGDDTDTEGDDEDGVVFSSSPPLASCLTSTLTVTASLPGKLDAWVDFDDNGDWTGADEQIFTSEALVAGPNALSFGVPCSATQTSDTFARFRFSTVGNLEPTGPALDGEVEDYAVAIVGLDFGDAPDSPYPSLLVNNGARHIVGGSLFLGASVDFDPDGQPSASADGDDTSSVPDDEDGVIFTSTPPLLACVSSTVTVTASAAGLLNAWVDFDDNGSWADPGEQVFVDELLVAGSNLLQFAVPCDVAPSTQSFARFRVDTGGGLSYDGLAQDGEVEDYEVPIAAEADIFVTKTDGVTSAVPGQDTLTYVIVVANAGPSNDPAVSLVDTFPAVLACTYTSIATGGATGNSSGSGDLAETLSLPVGSSVTYTVDCTIDSAASGPLSNTATSSGSVTDLVPGNDSATDGDTVLLPEADISVTKDDGVTSAVPGQDNVTYTIVVANAGPSDDPSVSLSDTFPAGLTCSWTSVSAGGASGNTASSGDLSETLSMPPDSSVTYTVDCAVGSAATGTLSNTASATASVNDPGGANNSATDSNTVLAPEADIAVTKNDGVVMAIPGGTAIVYTIVVTNTGPSDDANVSVVDSFPGELTCTWTSEGSGGAARNSQTSGASFNDTLSMPSGSDVTYTVSCTIDPAAVGAISNTVTVSGSFDSVDGNDSATDNNTVLAPEADVSVTKDDGVTSAIPGLTVTYTIVVANAGPSDDPSVSLSDTFPAALTCAYSSVASGGSSGNTASGASDIAETLSMPAGSNVTYTVDCTINPSATGTLANAATATTSVPDPDDSNNSATDSDTALTPAADVSITKTDSPDPLQPGQVLTYVIIVNNAGPSDAENVIAIDTLPAEVTFVSTSGGCAEEPNGVPTCTFGTIPAGGSAQYLVTVTVNSGTSGIITNTVSVSSDTTDPLLSNNTANEDSSVNTPPVANAGGPYLVTEGSSTAVLSGLASFDADQPNT